MLIKQLTVIIFILLIVPSFAFALDSKLEILEVEVNSIEADEDTTVYAERGSILNIHLELESNEELDDVSAEARISSYEYGSLEVESKLFDMERRDIHPIDLELKLPSDMDTDEKYSLKIEVSNSDSRSEYFETSLRIKPERHKLEIVELILSPNKVIGAGEKLFANVWIKNVGTKKEEDIEVKIKIPQLGVYDTRIISNLFPSEEEDDYWSDSTNTGTILLKIPKETSSGDYELIVEVYYNNGYDHITKKRIIHVENAEKGLEEDKNKNAIISIASNIPKLEAGGSEVMFRMSITNLENKERSYSVQIIGTQLWADAWAEPAFVTVKPSETKGIVNFLKAFEEAELGNHIFTVKIVSDNNIIEEKSLNVNVIVKQKSSNVLNSLLNSDSLTGMATGAKKDQSVYPLNKKLKVTLSIVVGLMVATGAYLGYRRIKSEDEEFPLEPKKIYY